jgi:hypothetical protein
VRAFRAIRLGAAGTAVAGMLASGTTGAWAAVPRAATAGSAATLIVRTVPVVKGVGVSLDGVTYHTDASGSVTIATTSGSHRLGIVRPASVPGGARIRFARWPDGIALAGRHIAIGPGTRVEQAGFVMSRPVSFRFTNRGRPVPLSEIGQLTMTNGLGQRFTFSPTRPPSVLAVNRLVRGRTGLATLPIRYSVRSVLIDGSDMVFGGSQNFSVGPHAQPWTIKVLLFPLQVKVRDAFFKFGIGDAVRIILPDGLHRVIPLGKGHGGRVAGLPRGTYELVPQDPGIGLSAPATLSGPQTDTLLMLSWIDLLVVAVFAVLFLIGLPLAGGRIARKPGRGHRLTWQAGQGGRPLAVPGRASTLHQEATTASRPGLTEAGGDTVGSTGVLNITSVMPAAWEAAVTGARTRGKRRRAR